MNAEQAGKMLANALEALLTQFEINLPATGIVHDERMAAMNAREALAAWNAREVAEPVAYGCHCDIESTVSGKPDVCVFDTGDIEDCIYAMRLHTEGKTQTDCRYWKPIAIVAPVAADAGIAKDAERYQWLRDRSATHSVPAPSATLMDGHGIKVIWQGYGMDSRTQPRFVLLSDALDAAIDAALLASTKEPQQ